jgi:uncharacterized protein HemX
MSRKSSTDTLIAAMRILARDIQSGDGVANVAIAEAADRLAEQQARIAELAAKAAAGRRAVAVTAGALVDLLSASDALIERWHTPLWKDAKPTAEYIAALRVAADNARRLLAGGE